MLDCLSNNKLRLNNKQMIHTIQMQLSVSEHAAKALLKRAKLKRQKTHAQSRKAIVDAGGVGRASSDQVCSTPTQLMCCINVLSFCLQVWRYLTSKFGF